MRYVSILFLLVSINIGYSQNQDSTKRSGKPIVRAFAAPVVLVGLGLYAMERESVLSRYDVKRWRDENYLNFSTHTDDYLQFVPMGLVYGIDMLGVKAKNDLINRSLLMLKTEIVVNGVAQLLKHLTKVQRPNETNFHSFPSGHTAQAFAAATFMHKELGHHSVWYSIGAYTMATSVGVLRILNDKHWLSDVLTGAGIGILSTNVVYLTHKYRWGKKPGMVLLPTYSNGPGVFVSFNIR